MSSLDEDDDDVERQTDVGPAIEFEFSSSIFNFNFGLYYLSFYITFKDVFFIQFFVIDKMFCREDE